MGACPTTQARLVGAHMSSKNQPPSPHGIRCVTYAQAQEILSLSRSSLYKLVGLGRLHPIKIPGLRSRRIVLTEIEELLNGAVAETADHHG